MNYIVLDLEWNQPLSNKYAVREPLFLKGEIVQIGAVKLDEEFNIVGRFKATVRPKHYTKMHFAVAKLTHLTSKDIKSGLDFSLAVNKLIEWCGDEYAFLTWGYDDIPMLKDNMTLNGLDPNVLPHFYNVQTIFDDQILREHRQCSLSSALERLGETIENAHDALSDAYGAALVCKHLDMRSGIEKYGEIELNPNNYVKYQSVVAARLDAAVTSITCPKCSKSVLCGDWVVEKTDRHLAVASCSCGKSYLVKYRFRRNADNTVRVSKAVYSLYDENRKMYEVKKAECFGKTRHFGYLLEKAKRANGTM